MSDDSERWSDEELAERLEHAADPKDPEYVTSQDLREAARRLRGGEVERLTAGLGPSSNHSLASALAEMHERARRMIDNADQRIREAWDTSSFDGHEEHLADEAADRLRRRSPEGAGWGEVQEALSRVTPEQIRELREECAQAWPGWPEKAWAEELDALLEALEAAAG